jgi:hypothetical protein
LTGRLSTSPAARKLAAWVVALFALTAPAWLIYRPDRERAFYVIDFAEFLPLLQNANGFFESMRALLDYYASHGRFNVIPYAFLTAKWSLFGLWSPGWQMARALLMVAVVALTYVLLRRLGASKLGATVGASIYLFAPPAIEGWVRLTMAEPLGAAITTIMSLRALDYQGATRWPVSAGVLGVGAVALILTKELMAPALLFPLGLALAVRPDGTFGLPSWSRRNVGLVAVMAAASLLAMLPVIAVYVGASDTAYASLYGKEYKSPALNLVLLVTGLVPFDLGSTAGNLPWAIAVTAYLLLVVVGWRAGLRSNVHRARSWWLLALAVAVPLAGIIVYSPIHWFAKFYFIPYLLGPALLLGMAATFLQSTLRSATWPAAAAAVIALYGIGGAATEASRRDAIQRRDAFLLAFVADSTKADSVHFALPRVAFSDWGGAMSNYAGVLGHRWPPTRDVSCEAARGPRPSSVTLLIVNLDSSCGLDPEDVRVIAATYRRVDWRRARIVQDSVRADVVLPASNGFRQ